MGFRRAISITAIFTLLATGTATAAHAQEATPTCNGLPATHVFTDLTFEPFEMQVYTLYEIDAGEGTPDNDVIVISQQTNWPHDAVPVINAGAGDDTICIVGGHDVKVDAGEGNDTVLIVESPTSGYRLGWERTFIALVEGGAGNDSITNFGLGALLSGGDGDDEIFGGTGRDVIFGGPDSDALFGGEGGDHIFGDEGDDLVEGGPGFDWMSGDEGNDLLLGGPDADEIYGRDGDDVLRGGLGDDRISGGPGEDSMFGGRGDDVLQNHDDFFFSEINAGPSDTDGNVAFGGPGNDTLIGTNRWDRLTGGPGDDEIHGFAGRDYLRGGPGDDLLVGGANIDTILGNTGADQIEVQGADDIAPGYGIDTCAATTWNMRRVPLACERTITLQPVSAD